MESFRAFRAGPDPFGQMWEVRLKWLQTAISIRHSDTVDVKFAVSDGGAWEDRVIALRHTDLLELSRKLGRPVTDPWCIELAARHLRSMIRTGEDWEKPIVTPSLDDLEQVNLVG